MVLFAPISIVKKGNAHMSNKMLVAAFAVGCMSFIAAGEESRQPPAKESTEIAAFFKDFVEALNAKDAERVKKMSGETWKQWVEAMYDGGRFEAFDVLSVAMGEQTNAVVKCKVVDKSGRAKTGEVVFTMKSARGVYSIDRITDPVGESRRKEFKDACYALQQLITSINNRSMESVKAVVTFADAPDFDVELSARGLSWIKEAVDNDVKIAQEGMGVSREGKDIISGRICVPDVLGGTNILRKVIFKGSKIDRAAPREKTKEEILKEFEERRRETRIKYEEVGRKRQTM